MSFVRAGILTGLALFIFTAPLELRAQHAYTPEEIAMGGRPFQAPCASFAGRLEAGQIEDLVSYLETLGGR